jgi:hypothetical protein
MGVIRWALWTLFFALAWTGHPWEFPQHGALWMAAPVPPRVEPLDEAGRMESAASRPASTRGAIHRGSRASRKRRRPGQRHRPRRPQTSAGT